MATIVNIDNNAYDINNLFSFNFDLLKHLLEALARIQGQNTHKLLEMEMAMAKKDVQIKKLEKKVDEEQIKVTKKISIIEEVLIDLQEELKKQLNVDFTNFKHDLNSLHHSTVSLNEKLQSKLHEKEDEDADGGLAEKLLEEKSQELLKLTVTQIVNNILQDKDGGSVTINNTTIGGGPSTTIGGSTIIGGGKMDQNTAKELQAINKKIRLLEDKMDSLNTKMDNYDQPLSPEDLEEISGPNPPFTQKLSSKVEQGKVEGGFKTDEQLTKILKRLKTMESSIAELKALKPEVTELQEKDQQKEENINRLSELILNLKDKLKNLDPRLDKITSQIEDLNVKVLDFDIYSSYKPSGNDGVGAGDIDQTKALVQLLEKKVFKKFEFIDASIKKHDEEFYKIKNELSANKNNLDSFQKNISTVKDNNEDLAKLLEELKNQMKEANEGLNNELNDKVEQVKNFFLDQINELNKSLNKKEEELRLTTEDLDQPNKGGKTVDEKDMKLLKDTAKKVMELDRQFKIFSGTVNIDKINKDINKLNDLIVGKASNFEFNNLSDMVNQMQYQMNFMKENVTQLMEDNKILDDITWLRKKVEGITSQLSGLKMPSDDTTGGSRGLNIEFGKYAETHYVNELNKIVSREIDQLKLRVDETKRTVDDILITLKSKVAERDVKALDELLNTRIDELKVACNRKFADRTETNKNLKYLDAQVKHIQEVYIKKMEKGDNWLLAKKPLGGHSCASCESYIGDIHESTQFLPWKKYPAREGNERVYRVGNGFSRMLQMITVDGKKETEMGDDMNKTQRMDGQEGIRTKDLLLPQVMGASKSSLNMSVDNIQMSDEGEHDDPYKPKIVKIYKKNKPEGKPTTAQK